jgi:regulation of enolase protein 1 (concanavalin A-like superfamily)
MDTVNRRVFLSDAVSLAGAALVCDFAIPLSNAQNHLTLQDQLIPRMKWMNEPASWKVAEGKMMVHCRPKTDFWRKTFYGYVTDNGHFFHLLVGGEFTFEARVNGQYAALYDQAGLMVRVDAENWVKCGTELVDGVRHASVVFTREFSDWSTMKDLSADGPVWWRATRSKDSLETLCSLDGETFQSVRQGYLVPGRPAEVGIMCATPEGGGGLECVFDHLQLSSAGE